MVVVVVVVLSSVSSVSLSAALIRASPLMEVKAPRRSASGSALGSPLVLHADSEIEGFWRFGFFGGLGL